MGITSEPCGRTVISALVSTLDL